MCWEKNIASHFLKGGKYMAFICFDVGGTAIKQGIFSVEGELLEKDEFPTPHNDKESFYQSILNVIEEYERTYEIQGIGLSMPGFIDPNEGKAITAGALYTLYEEKIVEVLQQNISYPIAIENDANCAALAEQATGHAQETANFLLITIGTGIGGAIVLNNELFRGNTFRAGEFGLMHIDVANRPFMTAHELASTSALVRNYKKYKGLTPETVVDARVIMQEKEIDSGVQELFEQWITYLAALIFNSSTFFNPEKILLGGGISADETLIPTLIKQLEKDNSWQEMKTIIQNCKYYNEAGLRGACALISEKVKRNHEA